MKPNHQILIVDGNPNDVRVVRAVLESAGMAIHVRTDGSSAIEAFHAIKPDLVLIDTHVPETNGVQISRELKQTDLGRATPIILMSSRTLKAKERKQALSSSGCALLLQKPVSSKQILETLSRFLPGAFVPNASQDEDRHSPVTEAADVSLPPAAQSEAEAAAQMTGPEAFNEDELSALLDQVFPSSDSGPLAGTIAANAPSQAGAKLPKRHAFDANEDSVSSLLDDLLPTGLEGQAEANGRIEALAATTDAEIVDRPGQSETRQPAGSPTARQDQVLEAELIDTQSSSAPIGANSPSAEPPAVQSSAVEMDSIPEMGSGIGATASIGEGQDSADSPAMGPTASIGGGLDLAETQVMRPTASIGEGQDSAEGFAAGATASIGEGQDSADSPAMGETAPPPATQITSPQDTDDAAGQIAIVARPSSDSAAHPERGGRNKKKSKAARREKYASTHSQSVQSIPVSTVPAPGHSEPEPAPLVAEQPSIILPSQADRTEVIAYTQPDAPPRQRSRRVLFFLLAVLGAAAILYYLLSGAGEGDLKPGASSALEPSGSMAPRDIQPERLPRAERPPSA